MVEIVQLQSLLPGGDRTNASRALLAYRTAERQSVHAIWSQVPDSPLDWTQMVECLQEGRQIQTVNSCHEYSDRYQYAGDVDSESGVVEESVEHYTHRLATRNNAEDVEGHGEVERSSARKADGESAENREEERCQDLERDF
jgi:hypothetical protein